MRTSVPANAYVLDAIAQARATRDAVARDFGGLGVAALNWKPAPDRWSVAQCLEHLIVSNESYASVFASIAAGTRQPTAAERIPLLPRLFGPLLRWSMAPDGAVKVKTTEPFRPSTSALPARIVDDFHDSIERLLETIESLDEVDHERVVLTSPFARFVCYRLKDSILVTVAHLERHRLQAVRVTEHPDFPRPADG